jgi:hypothetical protein
MKSQDAAHAGRCGSLVPLELPLSPVHFFTIGKRSLEFAVQSAQHPDACMHQRPAIFCGHDQRFGRIGGELQAASSPRCGRLLIPRLVSALCGFVRSPG